MISSISMQAPSDYLKDVAAAAGDDLPKWLQSNLISADAYQAALADDFSGFLAYRSKAIQQAVDDLADWAG